jgi:Domain of unknown function (DUF4189)
MPAQPTSRRRLTAAALLISTGAGLAAMAGPPVTAHADPVVRPAPSADRFVAIAYSPGTQIWGLSANKDNQQAASSEAISRCSYKASDCQVVVVAKNSCAALAVDGTRYFGGSGPTYAAANQDARLGLFGSGSIKANQCPIR